MQNDREREGSTMGVRAIYQTLIDILDTGDCTASELIMLASTAGIPSTETEYALANLINSRRVRVDRRGIYHSV
jgi:hypothetical protein